MTAWLAPDEQEAWRGLLAMTSGLQFHLNRRLQERSGLSLADFDVLVPLSEEPGRRLRVNELAARLGWEQSRLSHHLARMARRGLVVREECPTDRRGAFVALTRRGFSAIQAAAPAHAEQVRHLVFDGLTPDQVAALAGISAAVMGRLAGA